MSKYYYIDLESIETRDLTEEEKEWLNVITSVSYKGVDILKIQIKNAKVISECKCGCKSIGLKIDESCTKFDYKVAVPIKMFATYNDEVPVVFLLHVKDGYIEEFEVLKEDSRPIIEPISMENIIFDIEDY